MAPSLLILTHEYLPKRAGIATYVSETARAAWRDGWDVTILAPRYAEAEAQDRFHVIPTPVVGRQDWLDRLLMRRAVRALAVDWSGTTLWLPEPGPQRLWMYSSLLGLPKPRSLILTLHGSEILRFSAPPWRQRLFTKLLNQAELISVVSHYTKELLVSRYGPLGGRLKVTYGGVRTDLLEALERQPRNAPGRDFVILSLARIHPRKGQDLVIEAIGRLPADLRQKTVYRLVGSTSRKAYADALIQQANKRGVRLEGPASAKTADALARELRSAHLMVLTSKEAHKSVESFGLVFLEAAAAGCPVLATPSGGVSEAISGQSGCILESTTPDALSAKLEALMNDPSALQRWQSLGPGWAGQFSWDRTARAIFGCQSAAPGPRYGEDFFAQLDEELKAVEGVSLDVFDTVIQRIVFPKEVFALVEAQAIEQMDPSLRGFADARIEAESSARRTATEKQNEREVTLEDIYGELARTRPRWSKHTARLLAMEWEAELRLNRPHPLGREIVQRVKLAGKRLIFLSDMYLGESRLKILLHKCGYGNHPVICSSDHAKSKEQGTLYPVVTEQLGLPPDKILHLGDNPKSDFRMARSAGFRALSLRPPLPPPQASKRFPHVTAESVAGFLSRGLSVRQTYAYAVGAKNEHGAGHLIGYTVLGPLAYGLCRWLVAEIERRGNDLLLCLGRDGLMPYTILRQWQQSFGILPETRIEYVHCSRRACTLALAGDGISPLVLKTLSQHRRSVPLRDYFERIGLVAEEHLPAVREAGFSSLDEVVHRKEGRPRMERLIKALEGPLKLIGREEKTLLIEQLRRHGMDTARTPALFDLGWRGTQQSALQTMLDGYPPLHGYYLSIAHSLANAGTTHGFLVQDGKPALLRGALEAAIPILELLFSSPEPSFLYYTSVNDQISAVFDEKNPNAIEIEALHAGARDFVTDLTNDGGGPSHPLATEEAIASFLAMALKPTNDQLHYLSRLVFSDALGKEKPSILTDVKPPKLREFIFNYQYFFERYSQTAWRAHFIQQMSLPARIWVTPWSPSFRRIQKAIRTFGGSP